MLRINLFLLIVVGLLFTACKEEKKVSEVETRKEISEKLEDAGLHKKSSNSDEVIAAMNVIYKTRFESLTEENQAKLKTWSDAIDYDSPKKLYDDMFASFNQTEQVASLIEEYSEAEFSSYHDRDIYNQTVSLLFLKENDSDKYDSQVNLFQKVVKYIGDDMRTKGNSVEIESWNKGMSKNFDEYWYVHGSRILNAANDAMGTSLDEFLNRKAS